MSRGIKKPSLKAFTSGQQHAALVFARLACLSVGTVPPYRGKCLGVERWVRCVFWLSAISYTTYTTQFSPVSPSHPPFLAEAPSIAALSRLSSVHFPSTSRFPTFVEISCLMTAPFLFFTALGLDFLFLYCDWKGCRRRGNSTGAQSTTLFRKRSHYFNASHDGGLLQMKKTGHWAKHRSTPKYYLELI